MTPSKEILITTLNGILVSMNNTIDNTIDVGHDKDQDGDIYEDFIDLQESQEQLNKLIKELEQ